MQLVANQQLVKNRVRLGLGFHISALAVFALGLVLSTQIDATRELPWESWVAILAGLGLYSLGQTQLRRWGPRNRQEEQLGTAIRTLDEGFRSIDDVQNEKEQVLVDLANSTVRNDAADVVILAGAPLAGMADKVKERIPVPVVDGIQAAVTMAEGLVRLKPRKATAGTYRRPAAKDSKGLSAALADMIGHRGS